MYRTTSVSDKWFSAFPDLENAWFIIDKIFVNLYWTLNPFLVSSLQRGSELCTTRCQKVKNCWNTSALGKWSFFTQVGRNKVWNGLSLYFMCSCRPSDLEYLISSNVLFAKYSVQPNKQSSSHAWLVSKYGWTRVVLELQTSVADIGCLSRIMIFINPG